MNPETANSEPSPIFDSFGWFAAHPKIAIAIGAVCLWISLSLLFNLWLIRRGSFLRKLYWSLIVLIPFLGWLLYGGFYRVPDTDNDCNDSHSIGLG